MSPGECKIQSLLPKNSSIVLNGWMGGNTPFFAIFATFSSNQQIRYYNVLLALSLMGEADFLKADEHYEFLKFVQQVFNKSWDSIFALTSESCSTNNSFSTRSGPFFVRFYSHCYNLAMGHVITVRFSKVNRVP